MQPYSIDFRRKIIEIYEREDISIRKLAQRFSVTKSFVQKLLKQYRETGDITPRVSGGSPPSKLNAEQLVILVEIIEHNYSATLEELCKLLQEEVGIKVSRSTMGRTTIRLGYGAKQRRSLRDFRSASTVDKARSGNNR